MADGFVEGNQVGTSSGEDGGRSPAERLRRFLGTRNGLLSLAAVLAALALSFVVAANFSPLWGLKFIKAPFLTSLDAWIWFGTASCLLWLPLVLLLLDPPDNMGTGPGLALPFVTLGILIALAVASVVFKPFLDSRFVIAPGGTELTTIFSSAPLIAFFTLLSVGLVARIFNAGLFAQYAISHYRRRQVEALKASAGGDVEVKELLKEVAAHRKEQGNAEALSAVIATAAVLFVGGLAFVAGGWNANTHIGTDVGLIIAAIIVGTFSVVFLFEWLAEFPPIRALSRAINGASQYFAFVAAFYNFVDMLLVRIGAQVAGAGHNNPYARYTVLAGTQLSLAVMTWFLPDPLGLITAFIGFTLALSVARLWAWVEEDRHLALVTQYKANTPRRIGFKEDYKDEAIFGFIFVLALIPMALKQADAGQLFNLHYFSNANYDEPVPWLVYFSLELAKALPIVSWADIYLQQVKFDTLSPTHPWGQHATFLARVIVDLVLVSSLLQAINITLRNRQQKALYASRQINRLDELVEREELRKSVARPREHWFDRGLDFRHYDKERLRELHTNTNDERRKEFIDRIFTQFGESVGFTIRILEELTKRGARAEDLETTFSTVRIEHETKKHPVHVLDFLEVFADLRSTEGLKNFKFKLIDFVEEIGRIEEHGPPIELQQLLEQLIFGTRRDQFQYTRIYAAKVLIRTIPRLPDPDPLSAMLANLKAHRTELFGAANFVPDLLERALVERLREIGPPLIGN